MTYDAYLERPYVEQGEWEAAIESRADEIHEQLCFDLRAGSGVYGDPYRTMLADNDAQDTDKLRCEWSNEQAIKELGGRVR